MKIKKFSLHLNRMKNSRSPETPFVCTSKGKRSLGECQKQWQHRSKSLLLVEKGERRYVMFYSWLLLPNDRHKTLTMSNRIKQENNVKNYVKQHKQNSDDQVICILYVTLYSKITMKNYIYWCMIIKQYYQKAA